MTAFQLYAPTCPSGYVHLTELEVSLLSVGSTVGAIVIPCPRSMYGIGLPRGDSTREILDEICNLVHLPIPSSLPAGTTASLTYRIITAVLQIKTFAPKRWTCLNGFCDSSGFMGCGIRRVAVSVFSLGRATLRIRGVL
jgi:hypothetical protein